METFKKFLTEHEHHLLESSMSRVYQHTKDREIGMISAFRDERKPEENEALHSELKSLVRKAGYGFINVKGRYIENYGTPNARPMDEKSLLVIGSKGKKSGLLKYLKRWGEQFDQDSVLHKSHDSETAQLHGTSQREDSFPGYGKIHDVGKWHPNRATEMHSMLKGKAFNFEEFQDFAYYTSISWGVRKEHLF